CRRRCCLLAGRHVPAAKPADIEAVLNRRVAVGTGSRVEDSTAEPALDCFGPDRFATARARLRFCARRRDLTELSGQLCLQYEWSLGNRIQSYEREQAPRRDRLYLVQPATGLPAGGAAAELLCGWECGRLVGWPRFAFAHFRKHSSGIRPGSSARYVSSSQ